MPLHHRPPRATWIDPFLGAEYPYWMRRMVVAAALAWCAGLCMASGAAYGYAKLDAWRGFGEAFQLGYVVGYLDAVALNKRHDLRGLVPSQGKSDYERWRSLVNDYFADPANANRSLPDGMAAAGKVLTDETMKAYRAQRDAERSQPKPTPSAAEAPR